MSKQGNAAKKKKKTHTIFWEGIFRDKVLNGFFLNKSYLPNSSLTVLVYQLIVCLID